MRYLLSLGVVLFLAALCLSEAPFPDDERDMPQAPTSGLCREQLFYISQDVKEFLKKRGEKAIAVGLALPTVPRNVVEEHLDELEKLIETSGGVVVEKVFAKQVFGSR